MESGDSGSLSQPGVLADIPSHARYLTFRRRASTPGPRDALERLADPHPGRDHIVGRRKSDNVELKDGPDAAHVQRTEQEAPDPPAFLLRRSMPWADSRRAGLVFVAFGASLDAFEYHLSRMTGAADRIADHLFRFTRPVTGAYFWCPPLRDGRADLSLLG